VIAIAAAGNSTLALTSDRAVIGWGDNSYGQLNVPPGLSNVRDIALGLRNGFAMKHDGTLVQWGNSPIPQLPSAASGLDNVALVNATSMTAWTLDGDGTVARWGWPFSQIVDTDTVSIAVGGEDYNLSSDFLLSLHFDGSLGYSWNSYFYTPYIPVLPTNVIAIAANYQHAAVLINDGTPSVSTRIGDRTVPTGSTVFLSSGLVGLQPMTFQWQFNGNTIGDATNAVLTLPNVPLSATGEYRCIAANFRGSVTNGPGMLTVIRSIPQFVGAGTAIDLEGNFRLQVSGLSGHGDAVIYASTNLVNWEPVLTNPPAMGALQFTDPSTTNWPQRFYRIEEL
jgi:alpha-tubulin suppressor-like RCC1 family protein